MVTENRSEQISALADGELSDEQVKHLLKSITPQEIAEWGEMQCVGDVLRSSDLSLHHNECFLVQFAERLANEPIVFAPSAVFESASISDSVSTASDLKQAKHFSNVRSRFGRNVAMSAAAVMVLSWGLFQAAPPLDSEVQMVRSMVSQQVTPESLSLWQDYLQAHQQNSIRSGLSGVSPIARTDFEASMRSGTERVMATSENAAEWMNVWEPSTSTESQNVQFVYVSSHR